MGLIREVSGKTSMGSSTGFSLVLETLRFGKMSWWAARGRENLSAIYNLEGELPMEGFETVDLLPAFVKPGGSQVDLTMLLSPGFDLKSELLRCRVQVLTKTDCAVFRDSRTVKHTSCFYNYSTKQFVGNYKNRVFAQPAKEWCIWSFKGDCDLIDGLMEMGRVASFGGGFPPKLGVWSISGSC